MHDVVRFGAPDYWAAFRLARDLPSRTRKNVDRSATLDEVAPVLEAVAGQGGVMVGGVALSLCQHAAGHEVRAVRDIDVVALPSSVQRLRRHHAATVHGPRQRGKGTMTFWSVASEHAIGVQRPMRFRAPHRAGFGLRYCCATLPHDGGPLDVDFHLSTTLHPTELTCRAVQVGAHRIWALDPLSQLREMTALLAHFARHAESAHPGLRMLAHKRVSKARERIAALLPLVDPSSPA